MSRYLSAPPSVPPAYGLTLAMQFVRARDGDTIEVRLPGSAFVWAIRLINVWSPELHRGTEVERAIAAKAQEFVAMRCQAAPLLTVYIPMVGAEQPLKRLTFDRIPGWVWRGGMSQTLNEEIVAAGFASSVRNGPLAR